MRPPAPPRQPRRDPSSPDEAAHDDARDGAGRHPRRPDTPGERDAVEPGASTGTTRTRGSRDARQTDIATSRAVSRPATGSDVTRGERPRPTLGRWRAARPEDQPAGAFTARLAERSRAERRLLWRRALIALGVLLTLGALAWALLVSSLLALDLEQVTITGTGEGTTVDTADVRAIVEPHGGTPLPRLDPPGLREEITALPTVMHAQVTRAWPRGLEIDVVAREPVAALESDGVIELLDVEGITVDTVEEVPEGMALVDVPRTGERAAETLQAVLAVLAEIPDDLRADVTVAVATSPGSITLELDGGAEVHWGGATESELKAAVLDVLRSQDARVYDVTVPRSPTTSD